MHIKFYFLSYSFLTVELSAFYHPNSRYVMTASRNLRLVSELSIPFLGRDNYSKTKPKFSNLSL